MTSKKYFIQLLIREVSTSQNDNIESFSIEMTIGKDLPMSKILKHNITLSYVSKLYQTHTCHTWRGCGRISEFDIRFATNEMLGY